MLIPWPCSWQNHSDSVTANWPAFRPMSEGCIRCGWKWPASVPVQSPLPRAPKSVSAAPHYNPLWCASAALCGQSQGFKWNRCLTGDLNQFSWSVMAHLAWNTCQLIARHSSPLTAGSPPGIWAGRSWNGGEEECTSHNFSPLWCAIVLDIWVHVG